MRAVRGFALISNHAKRLCAAKKEERYHMEITVRITNVYGQKTVYPVCETARIFADIAGTKTLKPTTINSIKALGYTINVQAETI
jgi:hypothetical protein